MKILVVEDDENKRVQLRQFLSEVCPQAIVDVAHSLQSGLKKVRNVRPDLVLLDMTLPNYDPGPDESGGQTHPLGGQEFLSQIDRFDIAVPVIVVTQFETFGKGPNAMNLNDLDRKLRNDYGAIYKGTVYYHAAIQGWKQKLQELIDSLGSQKTQSQNL